MIRPSVAPPAGIHPALARFVEALARQAARDDYHAQEAVRVEGPNGDQNNETRRDIRQVFERPADR
ncbi:hypothetical protein [Mesorhizobium sp. KR9-304]|uniref:hypothetical protein n=1 Tax=Mesorhizobium sp. KR9-304 TaxID=3156614 RepID=UPI0032B609FA